MSKEKGNLIDLELKEKGWRLSLYEATRRLQGKEEQIKQLEKEKKGEMALVEKYKATAGMLSGMLKERPLAIDGNNPVLLVLLTPDTIIEYNPQDKTRNKELRSVKGDLVRWNEKAIPADSILHQVCPDCQERHPLICEIRYYESRRNEKPEYSVNLFLLCPEGGLVCVGFALKSCSAGFSYPLSGDGQRIDAYNYWWLLLKRDRESKENGKE